MLSQGDKGPILDDTTCIMGMDVTHPGPEALNRAPSIAAFVANRDDNFAQWTTSLRTQLPNDEAKKSIETIIDLIDMVVARLQAWRRHHNNTLPRKLIIYRDGVSESQFSMVQEKEIPATEAAISDLYDDIYTGNDIEHPQLLVLSTIKRHHTRFFPEENSSPSTRDSKGNPRPGCVVDSRVTLLNHDNFYLQSHAALVGTARPTHYVVLHNSNQTSIIDIQRMTFNLCFLYGRSVSSVGLVPAACYADLVCDRAGCYFRRAYVPFRAGDYNAADYSLELHEHVQDTLFFI